MLESNKKLLPTQPSYSSGIPAQRTHTAYKTQGIEEVMVKNLLGSDTTASYN